MFNRNGALRLAISSIVIGAAFVGLSAPAANASTGACTSAFSRDINSYVLFGYSEIIHKGANATPGTGTIDGGNVGVNDSNGTAEKELKYTGKTTMTTPGQQSVAFGTAVENVNTRLYDLYTDETNGGFDPVVLLGCGPTSTSASTFGGLPILDASQASFDAFTHSSGPYKPQIPAFNTGPDDLTVAADGTDSPTPGERKDLRVNDGGTLNLADGVYTFRSVSVGKNTTINTQPGTEVRIAKDLTLQDNAIIQGSSAAKFIIRSDGMGASLSGAFSHDVNLLGQFFAPNGHIDLGGGGTLTGRFWANKITGDPGNKIIYDCGPAPDEDANCKKPPPCVPGPGEDANCKPIVVTCTPKPGEDANCQPVTVSCVPKAGEDANCNKIPVKPSAVDSASLKSPSGCTTSYNVRVSGTNISKVVYKIDGKTVKTVKKAPFSYKLNAYKYKRGAHKLTSKTYFKSGKTKTQKTTFQHCGKSSVSPKFTG